MRLRPRHRYWNDFAGSVSGSDVSTKAVDWCANFLGRFEANRLAPPFAFPEESFDLVYALSVFTHLTDEFQVAWRQRAATRPAARGGAAPPDDPRRFSPPGSTHGERARFERGELVVRWSDVPGANLCSAYHPSCYLHDTFAQGFAFSSSSPKEREATRPGPRPAPQGLALARERDLFQPDGPVDVEAARRAGASRRPIA